MEPAQLNMWKLSRMLKTHKRCMQWCKEHNLLMSSINCPKQWCENSLNWQRWAGFVWRCLKKNCNGQASIRQNSWFSGSNLSNEKVIALTYPWTYTYTTTQAVHETSLDNKTTSTETVIDWYNYCQKVCADRANRQTWFDCWNQWVWKSGKRKYQRESITVCIRGRAMQQTKQESAQCVTPCKLIAGT